MVECRHFVDYDFVMAMAFLAIFTSANHKSSNRTIAKLLFGMFNRNKDEKKLLQ